jgi:hypothetical protein
LRLASIESLRDSAVSRFLNRVACGNDPDDDCRWQSWRKFLEGKRCVVRTQHAWQGRRFALPLHPFRAGGFRAPVHPRRGTRPGSCDLPQPCTGWIRGQAFAPDTTTKGVPAPRPGPTVRRLDTRSGFRARHHDEMRSASRHLTNPARIGCTATAYPVASIFGAFPQNPASAVSPADTNDRRLAAPDRQQERGPCTPSHDRRAGRGRR